MAKHRYNKWTKKDEQYLKDNLNIIPRIDIINKLGRTRQAIEQKIHHLNLGTSEPTTLVKINNFNKRCKSKLLGGKDDRDTLRSTARYKIRNRINRRVKEDSGRIA